MHAPIPVDQQLFLLFGFGKRKVTTLLENRHKHLTQTLNTKCVGDTFVPTTGCLLVVFIFV